MIETVESEHITEDDLRAFLTVTLKRLRETERYAERLDDALRVERERATDGNAVPKDTLRDIVQLCVSIQARGDCRNLMPRVERILRGLR